MFLAVDVTKVFLALQSLCIGESSVSLLNQRNSFELWIKKKAVGTDDGAM